MRRIRATVEYDGTAFSGFQRQTNARSVQGEIERAIERVTGTPATVIGAGRTDAGVHASGQVVAFDTEWPHPSAALRAALNVELAEDVAVLEVGECRPDFHPRYDALSRTYEYRIVRSDVRRPLSRLSAWRVGRELDTRRMARSAAVLIGEHDFAAFGSAPSGSGESTVRRVIRADVATQGDQFVVTIEANAFLFRMVRRIVATLVRAGAGELGAEDMSELLAGRDPDRVKGAAPACGLCFVKVSYET